MSRIKQSFCLPLFLDRGLSVDETVCRASEVGYAAVEIWQRAEAPFDELVDATREHGLRIASMCGHGTLTEGLNNPGNHGRIRDELYASIELAAGLDIPGVIVFSGNRNGRDDDESVDVCAEGIAPVMKFAEEKAVNLNMELLNSRRDHPGYQCDHTGWGVRFCKAVDSSRCKLLYDIYHMAIMEGDIIQTIRDNIAHIGHFHTAGNPGRGPLDENQELCYPAICRAIADAGYDLYVGHEFQFEGDPAAHLKAAFDTCNV
ncbi:MAG: sugar phosphate isomerase/epimerase [Planctomycetes bacterium]|nr:sugar phosphate isomerase/epimerase [Planctomycetota bacterium]